MQAAEGRQCDLNLLLFRNRDSTCNKLLWRHAYSVLTYSIQVEKGLCEKLGINRATCVYYPPPTHPTGGWVGV